MTYMHPSPFFRQFGLSRVRCFWSGFAMATAPVAAGRTLFFLLLAAGVSALILVTGQGRSWLELIWLAAAIGGLSLSPSFHKERMVTILAQGGMLLTTALALVEIVAGLPVAMLSLLGAAGVIRGWGMAGRHRFGKPA